VCGTQDEHASALQTRSNRRVGIATRPALTKAGGAGAGNSAVEGIAFWAFIHSEQQTAGPWYLLDARRTASGPSFSSSTSPYDQTAWAALYHDGRNVPVRFFLFFHPGRVFACDDVPLL
jgi:hypothetical protein